MPAPFFFVALADFDGGGNIVAPPGTTTPPLGFLQFKGTYTVNPDCTGTMTLTPVSAGSTSSGTASSASTAMTVNFVLTQAKAPVTQAPSTAKYGGPGIEFSLANSTETLFGFGNPQ